MMFNTQWHHATRLPTTCSILLLICIPLYPVDRACCAYTNATNVHPSADVQHHPTALFQDDFEHGLAGWKFPLGGGSQLVQAPDSAHGHALSMLTETGQMHALIRGSSHWAGVRIEGEVLFPEDVDSYLGFIYRYTVDRRRIDFGSLYIKGNGSYVQANPHHDTNVGRTIYPERRVSLTGNAAIKIAEWKKFAFETVGREAHLYVGDGSVPQLTLRSVQFDSGSFGFKPRNPGGAVLIDNIKATEIHNFSYDGPPRPDISYDPDELITEWRVLGPLSNVLEDLEASLPPQASVVDDYGRRLTWRPFPADHRGAVLTGLATEYRKSRRVAYFHSQLEGRSLEECGSKHVIGDSCEAVLDISSVDSLAIWLNANFLGFAAGGAYAWWDAGDNPEHQPISHSIVLKPGPNHLLIRVIGGQYATGGFFLRVRPGASEP